MIDLQLLKYEIERRSGLSDIGEKTQIQEYIYARAVFYEIARKDPELSLAQIGRAVNKDHAIVLHAREKFQKYMKKSEKYRAIYESLSSEDFLPKQVMCKEDLQSLFQNFERMQKRVLELQNKLDDRVKITASGAHKPLMDLISRIPVYHIETVKTRLEPMIQMLEKPSIHNNLPKQ